MYQKLKKEQPRTFVSAAPVTMIFPVMIMMLILLLVLLFPMMSYAGSSCTATIPVKVEVSGDNVPADVAYRLQIEAVTPNAPMPDRAVVEVAKDQAAAFGPISYTVPEDYEYKIWQTTESRSDFTLDTKIYHVTVRVMNDGKGGLTSTVWAVADSAQGKKAESFLFKNSYTKENSPGGGNGGGSDSPRGDGLTISDGLVPLSTIFSDGVPLSTILPDGVPLFGLPKTGDATNLVLWLVLMVISACGLGLSATVRRCIV